MVFFIIKNQRGWQKRLADHRSRLMVVGTVLLIGVAVYPAIISPMLYPQKWRMYT